MDMEKNGLVRLITAGNVDDGKSTLIGRLLLDSKLILSDQLTNLKKAKNNRGSVEKIDLSFLTDGLESEREQGITIDVAYRYFSTKNKKYIIADCPGHEQYTRNMVTGASNADTVILLVDVTKIKNGVLLEQTLRHTLIISLLKIKKIILAVNKMDLVDYDQDIFNSISLSFKKLLKKLNWSVSFNAIPISALNGDNIIYKSKKTNWYHGESLIESLEKNYPIKKQKNSLRIPIQYVMRWDGDKSNPQRAYAGRVDSGILNINDTVSIWPSMKKARIKRIVYRSKNVKQALSNQSVLIWLDKDFDISRGNFFIEKDKNENSSNEVDVNIAWLDSNNLNTTRNYILKQATNETKVKVKLKSKINLSNLKLENANTLEMNEIGKALIKTSSPILNDSFESYPKSGSLILIDETTNQTAAALMINNKS